MAHEHGVPDESRYYCAHSKFFGWPHWVPNEFGMPRQTGADPYRLLLQLDGGYGPGGSIYFMIRGNDLAAQRFEACALEVQCT